MAVFARLSLKYKILSIAFIGALGFITYLGFNYLSAVENEKRLTKIQQVNFPIADQIGRSWLELFAARTALQTAISESELDLLNTAKKHMDNLNGNLDQIATMDRQYQGQITQLKQTVGQYFQSASSLAKGMINGNTDFAQIAESAKQMNGKYDEFSEQLKAFRIKTQDDFASRLEEAKHEAHVALMTGVVLGVCVVAALVLIGWTIARIITSNINRIIKELAGMATGKGDLTVRLETKAQDEVGELVNKFNAFVTHLQLMVKVLANLAKGVTVGTADVLRIAEHTRTGIVDQQHEIQQVATAVTEMAQTAQEVSRNAGEASKATDQADHESQNGQRVVKENMGAITSLAEEIEDARAVIQTLSDEVQKIASASQDIRSIAEQTNLLALNAAIEAARAGEQGRGFAVVADEVRTLAGRTGQSTNEIEEIIGSLLSGAQRAVDVMDRSKERAYSSVDQSKTTGESLQSILKSVHTINEMNTLVATSAEEQSAVAEEVSVNIVRINEVSDRTVEDAEATSKATKKLSEQAEQLKSIVNEFKV